MLEDGGERFDWSNKVNYPTHTNCLHKKDTAASFPFLDGFPSIQTQPPFKEW